MTHAQKMIRMLLEKVPSLMGGPKTSFEIEINKLTVSSLLQIPSDKFEMKGLDKISVMISPIAGHVFLEITHLGVIGGLPDGYLLKPEEIVKIAQDRGLDPRGIDASGTVVNDGFVYLRLVHPQEVMCVGTAEELQAALDTMHAPSPEAETAAERSCKQMETLLKMEVERLRAEDKTAMEIEQETAYLRSSIDKLRSKPQGAREDRGAPLHGSRGDLLFDEALGLCEKFLEGKERTTIEAMFGTPQIPARAKMMTCDKRVAGGPAVGGTYYAAAEYALLQNGFVLQKDGTWIRTEKQKDAAEVPASVEHDRPVFMPEPGHMAEVIPFPADPLREL